MAMAMKTRPPKVPRLENSGLRWNDERSSVQLTASSKGMAAVSGAVLLVAASIIAARWGMANAVATDALSVKAAWQDRFVQSGQLPTGHERENVLAELNAARGLDPRNPELMEQAGILLAMPVAVADAGLVGKPSGAIKVQVQQEVINAFSAAVVARPVSAYAWANLAVSKYQAGQVDAFLYRALENAARLGPWEPDVQLVVTDLGFALWDEMPQALQLVVIQMATNAQQRYADKVFGIAERRGRMAVVCGLTASVDHKLDNKAVQLAQPGRCQGLRSS